jgi:hypothetical protein
VESGPRLHKGGSGLQVLLCGAVRGTLPRSARTPVRARASISDWFLKSSISPDTADGVRPQRLDRLFECLEGVVRTCPECSKKKLPLGALIVHLNDAHHWTRERIAAWVADPDVPQDESHAHH